MVRPIGWNTTSADLRLVTETDRLSDQSYQDQDWAQHGPWFRPCSRASLQLATSVFGQTPSVSHTTKTDCTHDTRAVCASNTCNLCRACRPVAHEVKWAGTQSRPIPIREPLVCMPTLDTPSENRTGLHQHVHQDYQHNGTRQLAHVGELDQHEMPHDPT